MDTENNQEWYFPTKSGIFPTLKESSENQDGVRWFKTIGRTRGSAARGCANAAPAAMPPPTEAREGCSGLVGDACTRQLDVVDDDRRHPCSLAVYDDAAGLGCAKHNKASAMSLRVTLYGSRLKDALSDMC